MREGGWLRRGGGSGVVVAGHPEATILLVGSARGPLKRRSTQPFVSVARSLSAPLLGLRRYGVISTWLPPPLSTLPCAAMRTLPLYLRFTFLVTCLFFQSRLRLRSSIRPPSGGIHFKCFLMTMLGMGVVSWALLSTLS